MQLLFFFFFQAEDGIRDRDVTGVQTCALPIWPQAWETRRARGPSSNPFSGNRTVKLAIPPAPCAARDAATLDESTPRSEERRVGKECRSRWSPYQEKKKNE